MTRLTQETLPSFRHVWFRTGAERFSMTIFQPPQLDDVEFERQLQLIGTELAVLKDVLER